MEEPIITKQQRKVKIMHRTDLLTQLDLYRTSPLIRPDEVPLFKRYVDFISNNPLCFERTHTGHVTGAVWIVSHDFSKALLNHHKKLNIWCQLGGHADGDSDIKRVALKEAREESGIENLTFVLPGIFDIDIHHENLPGSCEYHYDVRYLLQAPPEASFQVSEESHSLAWVDAEKITDYTRERTVLRLAEKIELMRSNNSLNFKQN